MCIVYCILVHYCHYLQLFTLIQSVYTGDSHTVCMFELIGTYFEVYTSIPQICILIAATQLFYIWHTPSFSTVYIGSAGRQV